jgi:plasmid stabilization system protein ParE
LQNEGRTADFKLEMRRTAILAVLAQAKYYRVKENAALAERWRLAVTETMESLCQLPERGQPCAFSRARELRRISVAGFPMLVYYRTDKLRRRVIVVNILHRARDQERRLHEIQ